MFNFKATISNLLSNVGLDKKVGKVSYDETPAGNYYNHRHNKSKAGISYSKLVVADRGNPPKLKRKDLKPSVGSRNDRPSMRRARRNVPR